MKKLAELVKSHIHEGSGTTDLSKLYDAMDRMDVQYVLRYALDFKAAAETAKRLGAGKAAQEFVYLARDIVDKFNRMDSIMIAAKRQLDGIQEIQ